MTNADPEVVERINGLGDQLAQIAHEQELLIKSIEAQKNVIDAENAPKLRECEAAMVAIKQELTQVIEAHRASLIAKDRQSFATLKWKFQFTKTDGGKTTVVEGAAEAIMKTARKFGRIKHVAVPPSSQKWRFKLSKFLAHLETHPEERVIFEEFLDVTEEAESLRMAPNAGHTVFHDGARISPPSITIKSK